MFLDQFRNNFFPCKNINNAVILYFDKRDSKEKCDGRDTIKRDKWSF